MRTTKGQKLNRAFLMVESKVQQIEQKLLKKHKLNISHRELIYLVFIHDNAGKRMLEIGELMGLSKGAFSNTVKTLVSKLLVKKERSTLDSRVMTLALDEKGLKIYKVHKEARKEVSRIFEKVLTAQEIEQLFIIGEKFSKAKL